MPDDAPNVLKVFATLLYIICPHTADSERLFSQLDFYEGQRRSGLAVDAPGIDGSIQVPLHAASAAVCLRHPVHTHTDVHNSTHGSCREN